LRRHCVWRGLVTGRWWAQEYRISEKLAVPGLRISGGPQLSRGLTSIRLRELACVQWIGPKDDFDPAKVIVDCTRPLLNGGLGPGRAPSSLNGRWSVGPTRMVHLDTPVEKISGEGAELCCTGIRTRTTKKHPLGGGGGPQPGEKGFRSSGILKIWSGIRNRTRISKINTLEDDPVYVRLRCAALTWQRFAPGIAGIEAGRVSNRGFYGLASAMRARRGEDVMGI